MSTASKVPETFDLQGDDAVRTLRTTGWGRLLRDSLRRFRAADGFSHSRALAFQIVLTLFPALIAVVGFATMLHADRLRTAIEQATNRIAPGPAGQVIVQALRQATRTARSAAGGGGGRTALVFGLVVALVSAATAMGQIERGANRIYGIERDRPTVQKYARASLLAVSAGLLSALALVSVVAGADLVSRSAGASTTLAGIWKVAQWPASFLFAAAAMALLFRASPRRRQPAWSWLAVGSAASVLLWYALTLLLRWYLTASKTFGQTYGPLAGVIGVMVWAFLSSLAILLGLAFAAQLEAVRAGAPGPVSPRPASLRRLPPRPALR